MRPLHPGHDFLIQINRLSRYEAHPAHPRMTTGAIPMLDLGFLLIGAVFLGACILYAYACDRL